MPAATSERKHVHYDHQDSCRNLRWTAKESFEYLHDRPWGDVKNFYSHLVAGRFCLQDILIRRSGSENRTRVSRTVDCSPSHLGSLSEKTCKRNKDGKWARRTFKIHLSYDGSSFDGWQKQPGLNTVQGLLEKILGKFVHVKQAEEIEAKEPSIEAAVAVAGRTDKGVSAFHQVCSFYTWRKDVSIDEIEAEINSPMPGQLRAVSISEVPREFHPNFSAKWRRYLYILPLHEEEGGKMHENAADHIMNAFGGLCFTNNDGNEGRENEKCLNIDASSMSNASERQYLSKPHNFDVLMVNQLLQKLEGQSLSYRIFARDTQASRSRGPATECFMHHARAAVGLLPYIGQDDAPHLRKVMCFELVANRFLRKMVRVLVATAIREAAAGANPDNLLNLLEATCRRASGPPAPPEGLCLVDIGYEDINEDMFMIK